MDRLGIVLHSVLFRAAQIRDGSGHTQDPILTSGGEAYSVKGIPHQLLSFFREAELSEFLWRCTWCCRRGFSHAVPHEPH